MRDLTLSCRNFERPNADRELARLRVSVIKELGKIGVVASVRSN
jgi:hypothetical protein